MPLTADDVRTKQFAPSRLGRRGYDESDVDDFLDEVVGALDERDARIGVLEAAASAPTGAGPATAEVATAQGSAPKGAPDGVPAAEAATALLALAERTAQEHVAAGEAAAAEVRRNAEREAAATLSTARAEARRLLDDAEQARRRTLADLDHEQQVLGESTAALRATAEQAATHLQAYLSGLLVQVRDLAGGPAVEDGAAADAPGAGRDRERTAGQPRELTAVPA